MAGRRIREDREVRIQGVCQTLNHLCGQGLQLATTVTAAAELVTMVYKTDPPFSGETSGFPIRKSLAREMAHALCQEVALLAPSAEHFRRAVELWHAYCQKGIREAFAQFGDYIDAALAMDPPEDRVVSHVAVGHPHIPYILKKSGARQTIHHF